VGFAQFLPNVGEIPGLGEGAVSVVVIELVGATLKQARDAVMFFPTWVAIHDEWIQNICNSFILTVERRGYAQ